MSPAALSHTRVHAAPSPKVSEALHELVVASHKLLRALWTATFASSGQAPRPLTALEEANQVRSMADEVLHTDPRFAQDLYAAAERHERAATN